MAMEPLISELEKSPVIIESGYNSFVFELNMKSAVSETRISSSQIICISINISHFVMQMPHSYIKGYKTGKSNIISYTDADKYIVTTHWENNNFKLIFFGEPLCYGKAPPYD